MVYLLAALGLCCCVWARSRRERGTVLCQELPARSDGFSAVEHVQWVRLMGLAAPWHVVCFWTRDRACVPCIGRGILNPWTPGEVPVRILVLASGSVS